MLQIRSRCGTTAKTVLRAVKRFREHNTHQRRPGLGRPRCTSVTDDRFMKIEVLRDRFRTAVQARNRLEEARQVNVSVSTVRRRLHEANPVSRRPAKGQSLINNLHLKFIL